MSQQQRCKSCGRLDRFNFHLPDEVWREVVPVELQGLVVCLSCFDEFAAEKGIRYAAHLDEIYFVGKSAAFRFASEWYAD
jgi:hypothetical protein